MHGAKQRPAAKANHWADAPPEVGSMEYMPQVRVSKEDFLALSDLAGEMSIMDYMSKVIHDHVAAQQGVKRTLHPEHDSDCSIHIGYGLCNCGINLRR